MGYVDCEEWVDPWQEHLDFEAGAENTELAFLRREAHEEALHEAAIDAQEMAEEAADFFVQEAHREAALESALEAAADDDPLNIFF